MKVLLLADPTSTHTLKWARSLAWHGLNIGIFGLTTADPNIYRDCPNISLFSAGFSLATVKLSLASPLKMRYLRAVPQLKTLIRSFQPDIVHSHFATSYGLLGALSGFHPYLLSVWGSDVFDFPRKSFLHQALLRFSLGRADKILSTSQVMAAETKRHTQASVEVTPFGVDLDMFKPFPVESIFGSDEIVIGTVKTLEPKYGITDLIQAFKQVFDRNPHLPLRLLIVGGGSQRDQLEVLTQSLGIDHVTVFTGRVSHDQVPVYYNMLTIFVALSTKDSESFGVSVVEAAACQKPVVVSNIGGLPEVVEAGVTGFVVP
ncbi:MAG TPA: glycosyltransferase, partial [Anaerolineae bacterium]|nr:glycosyltransferase [Anaerolineae bacterium]